MQQEESQKIRDEVIRALANEGEDIRAFADAQEALERVDAVDLPVWYRNESEAAMQGGVEDAALEAAEGAPDALPVEGSEEDGAQQEAPSEYEMLQAVFSDVRAQSSQGCLVEPTRWSEAGLVPAQFTAEQWEMFVYEYIEERENERAQQPAASAAPARSATRAVGVPRAFRPVEEQPCCAESSGEEELGCERDAEGATADNLASQGPGESAPAAPAPAEPAPAAESPDPELPTTPACDDIAVLMGTHSYYLYSRDHMSDAYARWAFLASEDNRVVTFVECVREESRTYPRPMEADALTHDPFGFTAEEVAGLWDVVRESGAYPDIATTSASNGDVYYFSTDHLSPALAASLAEWNSVERYLYL